MSTIRSIIKSFLVSQPCVSIDYGKRARVFSDKEKYCEGIELFCSTLSSVVGRFYLSACEWLEWKRRSVAQSVGFLYGVVASLQPALMWVFMSRKDISWVKC